MYVVITFNPDGDSYLVTTDETKAKAHFDSEVERLNDSVFSDSSCPVFLAKIEDGVPFGSGSYGDLYGCEVIEEFYPED